MKIKTSFLSIAIFLMIYSLSVQAALSGSEEKRYQQIVLNEVNRYRLSKGLNALHLDNKISQEAKKHSMDMANKHEKFGHHNFDKRIQHIKAYIAQFNGGAENVACFKIPPKEVVRMWLTSSGHKRNIESKANLTGIGVAQDGKGWIYYTQIFVNGR